MPLLQIVPTITLIPPNYDLLQFKYINYQMFQVTPCIKFHYCFECKMWHITRRCIWNILKWLIYPHFVWKHIVLVIVKISWRNVYQRHHRRHFHFLSTPPLFVSRPGTHALCQHHHPSQTLSSSTIITASSLHNPLLTMMS